MTTISYLIALYNKSEFVLAAIDSVLNDSSDFYNIEVCIVNDGSTDDSFEKVLQFYENDPRVRLHSFPSNRGKNAAYNKAFEISSGEFIALLGADDEIVKGRTLLLLNEAVSSNKVVYGGLIKREEGSSHTLRLKPPKSPDFYKNIIQNRLSGGCFLAHRKHISGFFPIPEDLGFEDWWFSFHFLRTGLVKTVSEPVLVYRIHGSNDFGSFETSFDQLARDYERHFPYLSKFKLYLEDKRSTRYYLRSLDLRLTFLGRRSCKTLFFPPYDSSSIALFFLLLFGSRTSVLVDKWRRRIIRNLFY